MANPLEFSDTRSSCPPASNVEDASLRPKALRKKVVRRALPDHSRALRCVFQFAFVLLNVWIGAGFYAWVRVFEAGTQDRSMTRPAGVEGWLPLAGLMNFKCWVTTGRLPATHPAAMFLLVAFLAIAFLFRRAFCSWLCPIGTLSEYLWQVGRRMLRRNLRLPRWLDLPLRSLKYVLLGFFVWAVASMSGSDIEEFMHSPYGAVADVRMLNFFRYLGQTAVIVLAILVLASMLVQNFWCRYLCPYGALLGLASLPSPLRIRRSPDACIDCAKCARVCPSSLPVDKLITIKSAECTGCLECVAVCPAEDALQMSLPVLKRSQNGRRLPAWAMAVGIAALFLAIIGYAKASGHWNGDVPDYVYRQLVPHANELDHP